MANPEHVAILKQGVDIWNAWKHSQGPNYKTKLAGVNLAGMELMGIDFVDADLTDVNFKKALLSHSSFKRAELVDANLSDADLSAASLKRANIFRTNLSRAKLENTVFSSCKTSQTLFTSVDLGQSIDLDKVTHFGPSSIGTDTINKSKGQIPKSFLRGCGLSDWEIEFAKLFQQGLDRDQSTQIAYDLINLYNGQGLQFHSCFISYSSANEIFASKLHDNLQENGVRCWFAPEDLKIGDRIRPTIDQEIQVRDKLLVILSENSIDSEWVGDEVEAALEEESASGRTILFPIRLDDAVMESRSDWAAKIKRRRHIGDFSGWQDEAKYQKAFERLLRDLKSTGGEG